MIYRFNRFILDEERIELHSGSGPVEVEPQVFSLLLTLIRNRHRVVGKDELIDAVWGGRIVSDSTLSSRINAARRAVGDSGKTQSVIHTLARRGFRFVAAVTEENAAPGDSENRRGGGAQTIRFCTTADGVRLAYAVAGAGPPLVKAANWLNHLEYD